MHVANVCFQVFQEFHTLQVFYLDVAYTCNGFFRCFASISNVCFRCFSYFGRMLEVFYLDVTKVYLVLHMLQ
jgi:hypothetical protein